MYEKGYPGTWESSCCSVCGETATRFIAVYKYDPARHGDWECRGDGTIRGTKKQSAGGTGSEGKRSERNGDVSSLSALIVPTKRGNRTARDPDEGRGASGYRTAGEKHGGYPDVRHGK